MPCSLPLRWLLRVVSSKVKPEEFTFDFSHTGPMSEADRVNALKNLKDLLDAGALTQAEFDAQKQKLLNG